MPLDGCARQVPYGSFSGLRRRKTILETCSTSPRNGSIQCGDSTGTPVPRLLKAEEWSSSSRSKDEVDASVETSLIEKSTAAFETIEHTIVEATAKGNDDGSSKSSSCDDDDDDSASVSSLESLLSALSSARSEKECHSQEKGEPKGIERLERQLQLRRELLARFKMIQSPSCYKLLETHERAANAVERKRYDIAAESSTKKVGSDGVEKTLKSTNVLEDPVKGSDHPHSLLYAWWWVLFECHHSGPAAYKLLLVCLCHLFFHGALDTLSRIVYHNIFVNAMRLEVFYSALILLGLCILRANGYIWMLLDSEAYSAVKFDMHNRRLLDFTDAKVLAFLKSSLYGSAANLFGFYLVYVGLNQISSQELNEILKYLEQWYIDRKDAIIRDQNLNQDDLDFYSWEGTGGSTGYSEDASNTCMLLQQYIHPRLQWWFSYCCNDRFQEWKAVEMLYYGLGLVVVAASAATVGVNLLEICDEE
ncbi:hypothetical protein IV203_015511 [Nitzschia inconspicua]|uniref:Uncharacterized protein n=1 Tax=Nitzschia inconspicua TaxID=303405 RepID=A0A9K3LBE5_9STRA|nr:hypothetical protein IV203_015511 [Nitzschia inconspicua]